MYRIRIHPDALIDIQEATDWYNEQRPGLGERYQTQVVNQINKLKTTAEIYNVRYDDVRCVVMKKFPFMVHFTLDKPNQIVTVYAVFHTSKNPKIWSIRR